MHEYCSETGTSDVGFPLAVFSVSQHFAVSPLIRYLWTDSKKKNTLNNTSAHCTSLILISANFGCFRKRESGT